jgi:hypothetical protein
MPAHGSRELHRVPARRGSQLLARSALITRWDSNQVPMDHNCQPARRGLHHAGPARSRSISRRSQLLALGSKVVHTAGPGIHLGNCIEYRPAGDCIMLARSALITRSNSNRPAGDRNCKPARSASLDRTPTRSPWGLGLCIMPAHGSRELHRVPARRGLQLLAHGFIHRGNCIEYRPAGIAAANRPGVDRFADVRSCWPWDPGLCICWRMDPGNCIEYRPEGDCSCNTARS